MLFKSFPSLSNVIFFAQTKGSPQTLMLEFAGRSNRKSARLLHKFHSMTSVTICTHLRFDANTSGASTVFSYSTKSYVKELQLRANLVKGRSVHLALLVHGVLGLFEKAFDHDNSWHSVCVSWSHDGGRWSLYADGLSVARGDGLNSTGSIGTGGLFIIGQEQTTFGGSFREETSFSGSITELYVWDRVLHSHEIEAMAKKCSPVSSRLVFNWSGASMKIESSLTSRRIGNPCSGKFTLHVGGSRVLLTPGLSLFKWNQLLLRFCFKFSLFDFTAMRVAMQWKQSQGDQWKVFSHMSLLAWRCKLCTSAFYHMAKWVKQTHLRYNWSCFACRSTISTCTTNLEEKKRIFCQSAVWFRVCSD